jgi:hypothetical protein
MTDRQPTKEEIQKFWEWCGLVKNPWTSHWFCNHIEIELTLDLNNLFKYAVPNLKKTYYSKYNIVISLISDWATSILYDNDKDPALALFWAIMEAIK